MSLLDKLFGKKDNKVPVEKTSELLDEDLYWQIIDKSLKNTQNQIEQEKFITNELSKLEPNQIIGFKLRTDRFLADTYTSEMWCAGYIMNGGCSDDGFDYFRGWVISKGKEAYYQAKTEPDTLIKYYEEELEFYEFENFWYLGVETFKNKTGFDLDDFIEVEHFNQEIEFNWTEEDDDSRRQICPKLFNKFENIQ